jgi:quercetin dioxygenase-like cupin family protein
MKTADLTNLEMLDAWYENDPAMRVTVNFPFFAATGNKTSSVVYFEIEPGHYLGTHTDSAEEILLIPEMVPHGVRNIGQETARCVGFFSAATVVSTFDQPMMPFGARTVGTPPVEATV